MLDVTVMGTVKRRQALTRSGARPGDDVYVSGTIGAAAAGLQMLRRRRSQYVESQAESESSTATDDGSTDDGLPAA